MTQATDGIDFAELSRRRYEGATPEERARIDAVRAARARAEATRGEMPGHFERFAPMPRPVRGQRTVTVERVIERTWTKPLGVTIEGGPGAEAIRFHGAVTGHEAFRLDPAFCASLEDPDENRARPRFYLCAGTPGRYDGCWVEPAAVAAYLRERRPGLFPGAGSDAAPDAAPGMAP